MSKKVKDRIISEKEVEAQIDVIYEENYNLLQLDGAHALSKDIKKYALNQVKAYFHKLKDIACKVTDVEIKLTLANLESPNNRRFAIEGVVDIVEDSDHSKMYDIKSHEGDFVEAHKELYRDQLNIYKYIWEGLNDKNLDETLIISTALPDALKRAYKYGSSRVEIDKIMKSWEPMIGIDTDKSKVEETICEFGEIVDAIEEGKFSPTPIETLKEKVSGSNQVFATRVCRNCDIRFSCRSYVEYAKESLHLNDNSLVRIFKQNFFDDEREDYLSSNIDD